MASTSTTFDTDCKAMLHNDDAGLTDSSASANTVTLGGNVARSNTQSKFGGFSAVFDGTSDYLQMASVADFAYTADVTIDFWVYFLAFAAPTEMYVWGTSDISNRLNIHTSGGGRLDCWVGGTLGNSPNYAISTGQWYHIAITRSGTTAYIFVDGTQQDSWTASGSVAQAGITIGIYHDLTLFDLNGYIDEWRYVKGTAVWTANFTPPTAAYTQAGGGATKFYYYGVG
jgi:hypothetical protein